MHDATEPSSGRRGSRALQMLNGTMALACGLEAVIIGSTALGLLVVGASIATGWPRGGFDLQTPIVPLHVDPHLSHVITGSDVCVTTAGRRACHHVTRTVTSLAPPDSYTFITGVCATVLTLPLAALCYGLAHATACFAALARGRWFDRRTITHLRDFAFGGLAYLALSPAAPGLASEVGRWGERLLMPGPVATSRWSFHLDLGPAPMLLTVTYAVALAVITAVLAHARKVAEDHAQIV